MLPDWASWQPSAPFTVGAEEEVMLLAGRDWSLAQDSDRVLEACPDWLAPHVTGETHRAAVELASKPQPSVPSLVAELAALRDALVAELSPLGLRAASAGTHPFAVWQDTRVSTGQRYQAVYDSMRELARREPTFALHVHVGVPDPEQAVLLLNRLRAHLPLLLAVSVNSPFWQGRDTGLASARTPLFQAFPRVGIPRAFSDYEDWVTAVEPLVSTGALEDPTFLWWDVRLQPRFGTVEVRILDAQTELSSTASLCALVQAIARLELQEGWASQTAVDSPEVLAENRFLAARDGMDAEFVDPARHSRVPAREQLTELIGACSAHAAALGCERELRALATSFAQTGADRQRVLADEREGLRGLVAALSGAFPAQVASGIRPAGETRPSDLRHPSKGRTGARA